MRSFSGRRRGEGGGGQLNVWSVSIVKLEPPRPIGGQGFASGRDRSAQMVRVVRTQAPALACPCLCRRVVWCLRADELCWRGHARIPGYDPVRFRLGRATPAWRAAYPGT